MPLRWRIRHLLAELLPRWLAVALGIRILSPGDRRPGRSVAVRRLDTGGAYRAKLRMQDPSIDPREPGSGDSSSEGTDHAWANCTMSSAATAIAYQQPAGGLTPWGGDLRHRQGDMSGGTDLYDARQAWSTYGETLTIRTGAGWSGVKTAHSERRAIVVQGEGNVPGAETYDGGHACVIGPETHSDGRWLFGDPLASDWQWVDPGAIRSWMERISSGCYFAVGQLPPPPAPDPPPAPAPQPPAADYGTGYHDGYREGTAAGYRAGEAHSFDAVFASWAPGRPFEPPPELEGARWSFSAWPGAAPPAKVGDPWAAWPLPLDAVYRAQDPAEWQLAGWTAAVWRD